MVFFLLGLTGSEEGRNLINQCEDIVASLFKLTEDPAETVAKDSLLSLVNLSADEDGSAVLLKAVSSIQQIFLYLIHNYHKNLYEINFL